MDKFARMAVLLDIYGNLLTAKQRDVLDLYYNHDLSLAEIAENQNISRQGVHDLIKRGEQTLLKADERLRLLERWDFIEKGLRDILLNVDAILEQTDEQMKRSPEETRNKAKAIRSQVLHLLSSYLGG